MSSDGTFCMYFNNAIELRERGKLQEVDPGSQTVKSDTNVTTVFV